MATLAESFLADLDDLSDASDREDEAPQEEEDTKVRPCGLLRSSGVLIRTTCSRTKLDKEAQMAHKYDILHPKPKNIPARLPFLKAIWHILHGNFDVGTDVF